MVPRAAGAAALLALVAACGRKPAARTLTLRSGTPEGPRVTDVSPDDRTRRVAVELCRHAESCGRAGRREHRWATASSCVTELERELPARLGPLGCKPEVSRPRLDACLAELRSAGCAAREESLVPACRGEVLCGESVAPAP